MVNINEKIVALIEPALAQLGYELIGCDRSSQGNRTILRIYIDKPGGVLADDCAKASRTIGAIFDVEDAIPGRYTLEVSSPGIDRPLFTLAHFTKVIGQSVYVKLHTPIDERRQWTGKLESIDIDVLHLVCEDHSIQVPVSNIEKAHLCAEVKFK